MLKRVGESRHPCRTPTVVLNHSPVLPLNRTALWALSYRFSMARMMLALMLYFLIVAHKASCHTLSNGMILIYVNLNELFYKRSCFNVDADISISNRYDLESATNILRIRDCYF